MADAWVRIGEPDYWPGVMAGARCRAGTDFPGSDSARRAFSDWRRLSFSERESYVHRFIEQIEAQRDELAGVIHEETGKPLWESKTEIAMMIAKAAVSKKPMKSAWPA